MHITVYFENKLEIMSKRKQKTVCAIWYHLSYKKRKKKTNANVTKSRKNRKIY